MIVIGSNTSDNGQSCFTEDVSHFMELRQNRQLALLKRSAKKQWLWWFDDCHEVQVMIHYENKSNDPCTGMKEAD